MGNTHRIQEDAHRDPKQIAVDADLRYDASHPDESTNKKKLKQTPHRRIVTRGESNVDSANTSWTQATDTPRANRTRSVAPTAL